MATIYKTGFSRRYNIAFLATLLVLLSAVIFARNILPVVFLCFAGGFLFLGSVASILALVSQRDAIAVTDDGIVYRPRFFPLLEFKDIVQVTLVPRVQRLPDGRWHDAVREEWRPVILRLRDFTKYSARLPALLRSGVRDPDNPELARIEISFQGLAGDAREFYKITSSRVEQSQH